MKNKISLVVGVCLISCAGFAGGVVVGPVTISGDSKPAVVVAELVKPQDANILVGHPRVRASDGKEYPILNALSGVKTDPSGDILCSVYLKKAHANVLQVEPISQADMMSGTFKYVVLSLQGNSVVATIQVAPQGMWTYFQGGMSCSDKIDNN